MLTPVLWLTGIMESGYKAARGDFMCGCEHSNNIGICEGCYTKNKDNRATEEFGRLFKDFRLFPQIYQNRVLMSAFIERDAFCGENGKRVEAEFCELLEKLETLKKTFREMPGKGGSSLDGQTNMINYGFDPNAFQVMGQLSNMNSLGLPEAVPLKIKLGCSGDSL